MQHVQQSTKLTTAPLRRMARLAILLAAIVADPAVAGARTTYRVVNLAPGLLAGDAAINAWGQVAFSMQRESGARTYFYDGRSLRDIGPPEAGEVRLGGLNDLGQVVLNAGDRAYLWSAGGGLLDIGTGAGADSVVARAINNRGVVTGAFQRGANHAFRWSVASGLESLGAFTPGPQGMSSAAVINDAGVIAGVSLTAANQRQAFAWTRGTGLVNIDSLDSADTQVIAIGPWGEVAGNRTATVEQREFTPFLWTPSSGMLDLGSGAGIGASVIAMAPNQHIAGAIRYADRSIRAFRWTRPTGMRDLGTLGGLTSRPFDINARGQIVGWAFNASNEQRAFFWSAGKGMLDLNDSLRHAPPGLVLSTALAVNDGGAIVAISNAGPVLLRPDHGPGGGPVLGPIVAPSAIAAGVPLQASIAYLDPDRLGTRSVSWAWGDGSTQAGRVRERDGASHSSASHVFAAPGTYTVLVTVVDRSGRSTAVSHDVMVSAQAGAGQ